MGSSFDPPAAVVQRQADQSFESPSTTTCSIRSTDGRPDQNLRAHWIREKHEEKNKRILCPHVKARTQVHDHGSECY